MLQSWEAQVDDDQPLDAMFLVRRCKIGRRMRDVAVAVDPGILDTYLGRTYLASEVPSLLRPLCMPFLEKCIFPWILLPPHKAAETMLYAASAPAEEVAGRFVKDSRVAKVTRKAADTQLAERLWDVSCNLTGSSDSTFLK